MAILSRSGVDFLHCVFSLFVALRSHVRPLTHTLITHHMSHITHHRYDTVTSFVQRTFLGHYERAPQCPDLLRKGWRGVVELPSVPFDDGNNRESGDDGDKGDERDVDFLFVGRLYLYGPERVCSVRNAVASIGTIGEIGAMASTLDKTVVNRGAKIQVLVVNSTDPAFNEAAMALPSHSRLSVSETRSSSDSSSARTSYLDYRDNAAILQLYHRSKFCLVTKADSYSSTR